MIRFLASFAWLRWRLLANALKGAKRRDKVERFSRALGLIVPIFLAIVFIVVALAVGFLGFAVGHTIADGTIDGSKVVLTMRACVLAMTALVVIVPLSATTQPAIAGSTRLLLLPIPRRALHFLEVTASLADPWVAFALPGLFLFAVGLAVGGAASAAFVALGACVAMSGVLSSLSSLVSHAMRWLVRKRGRGELFTLVFVLAISLFAVVPALLGDGIEERLRDAKRARSQAPPFTVDGFDRSLPVWTRALPSELYGRSLRAGIDGRGGEAWMAIAILCAEAALLYAGSSAVHRRLVESTGSSGSRRRRTDVRWEGKRIRPLDATASAVAFVHARNTLRSVRGRLVVLLPAPLLAVFGLLSQRLPRQVPGGEMFASEGHVLFGAGVVFSLYTLLSFTMNQFGCDRAGLTMQFLAPVHDRALVRGKAAGNAIVFAAMLCACALSTGIVAWGGPVTVWIAIAVGGLATYALLCPLAAWMSAVFPVASDLSKTGTGGNPHGLAMLIGTLAVLALSAVPGTIVAVAYHFYANTAWALALTSIWLAIALAISIPMLDVAAGALARRRENVALVASGR